MGNLGDMLERSSSLQHAEAFHLKLGRTGSTDTRKEGLRGCIRGRRKRTTRRSEHAAVPAEDLVRRDFTAAMPNRLWTADITYVDTEEGFLYLAFVLDAYSRRLVGWAMESHLRTELVVDALQMAVWRRKPAPRLGRV
jgi:putative transposase